MVTASPSLHLGIIMDGNGRWATKRGLPRTEGHRQGLEAAKRIVAACSERGVTHLSLYTFSTENWKRTKEEVGFLMGLIKTHLAAELDFYRKNRIRLVHSGNRGGLSADILREIDKAVSDTSAFPGMVVNLAINYGGRDEVLRAVGKLVTAGEAASAALTEKDIAAFMDHPEMPDPDLIIRTGGEMRLSNFLLWQSAYSELYFTDCLWPDFDEKELDRALSDFRSRNRRFGGL
jgi:undecaprenyl diphosphate synthase